MPDVNSAIIVLGAQNDEEGNLSDIAKSRCDRAYYEFQKRSKHMILCTGGFGETFNKTRHPHAKFAQEYLRNKGVPRTAFLDISKSSFTMEDATLSDPILRKNGIQFAVLVTSDFHMTRAKLVFDYICPYVNFEYVPAETNLSEGELEKLRKHELEAIEREKHALNHP